ncbi:hypothetical protein N7508_009213 [Penicillium antarcticum]|uniref:uncharacterized protein n=1 Tax=Penicillium antarcticum TaxID=416450 RepID=UPI00239AC6DC|nr:uncharacterized protein N7508_009213 [Penicillium antarcticum]KAJ5294392.1 hypothetical protein N7508_009213 [Penicillium antarcticum]
MALMLAPYNEAMRIGMGFNSYTQQLCLNDVVRKAGGVKATEKDLHTQVPQVTSGNKDDGYMENQKGELVRRSKMVDGQKEVSQVVSWEAGFVDNISEVTEKLNIKGALQITCDAIGGGAGAEASYVNNSGFAKADVKYDITVKVTNERRIADDVVEFCPLPHAPEGKFTELYGDCFISGFIEGGVFHALVTKTKEEKSALKRMEGEMKIEASLARGAVKVEGSGGGGKSDETKEEHYSTQISVNWSGGGDIKSDGIVEWDVKNLMQVAMEFPDNVASCPQRTFAILTKYTALRSYHEQTTLGSPLDYENAGIYTGGLLDAYAEYKTLWKDIHQTISDVNSRNASARPREVVPGMKAYAESFDADYKERLTQYNGVVKTIEANREAYKGVTVEKPLPPNEVVPYRGDLFDLDKARRDCRFEMIKIVREVNEVTVNPQIATDPNRNWRYLSPNIFKLLVPTTAPPVKTKNEEDLEASKLLLEQELNAAREENSKLMTQQQESSSKNESVQAEQGKTHQDQLDQAKKDLEAFKAEVEAQKAERENAHRAELTAIKAEAEAQKSQHDNAHRAEVDALKTESENQKAQRDNAHRSELQSAHDELNRMRPKVLEEINGEVAQILVVTYGGMVFYDQGTPDQFGVVPKFLGAIHNQGQFRIENGIFTHDPNHGIQKFMCIIYRYNKPGQSTRLRTLVGEEGKVVQFDRW